jgi:hypothetical protein
VPGVDGTYAPARRVDSNVFSLRALVEQMAVRIRPEELTLRPAFLPAGGFTLREAAPGLYRGRGLEVSFDSAGGVPIMQIGGPVLRYVRVPWWQSAATVVPLAVIATLLASAATLGWLMALVRRTGDRLDEAGERVRLTTRVALLLDLTAVVSAAWLVFWGWPFAALSSPVGASVALLMYAAAWTAVLLTPLVVWYAHRLRARQPGTRWLRGREYLFVVAHLLLTAICLQWRMAGTTLAF